MIAEDPVDDLDFAASINVLDLSMPGTS